MDEESILISQVPRSLEVKSKIFGFELADILVLFLNLAIENLVFGSTALKGPMVYGTTLIIGSLLFFVKRGKPDKFIQHSLQFLISPTVLYAGLNDRQYQQFPRETYEKLN